MPGAGAALGQEGEPWAESGSRRVTKSEAREAPERRRQGGSRGESPELAGRQARESGALQVQMLPGTGSSRIPCGVSADEKRSGGESSQGDGEETASERERAGEGGVAAKEGTVRARGGRGGQRLGAASAPVKSSGDRRVKVAATLTGGASEGWRKGSAGREGREG